MNSKNVSAICALLCMALGMAGLHLHIEYSGWVLFVGCLWAFAS